MITFSEFMEARSEKSDPCWKNYKKVGEKKKNGKTVPNCVPKESTLPSFADFREAKSQN